MCSWKWFSLCLPNQGQQDDLQYASLHFFQNQPDPLYSNVTPARPVRHTEQHEVMEYTAVKYNSARPAPRWAALKLWNKLTAVACFVFIIIRIWWKLYDSLLYLFFLSEVRKLERIQLHCTAQSRKPDDFNRHCIHTLIFTFLFFIKIYIFIRKYSLFI